MRPVDQDVPIAGARADGRRHVVDRSGKRRIAFDQMHGNDSVEPSRIELIRQHRAQRVLAFGSGAEADDAQHSTTALSAADGDMGDGADHVLETRHGRFRPRGRIRQYGAIGRAVQHRKGFGGIEAEVFWAGCMRDVTPRLEKTVDRDALLEMLAIIPEIEFALVGGIDVHRRQQHPFSSQWHSCIPYCYSTFILRSALLRASRRMSHGRSSFETPRFARLLRMTGLSVAAHSSPSWKPNPQSLSSPHP